MPILDTVTSHYERDGDPVSPARRFLPSPATVATSIGLGRVLIGAAFMLAPTVSMRLLGVDTATAKRMTFLARMAAARDVALGAGTLQAAGGRGAVPWLLAGAGVDLADALAIAGAIKVGIARGVPAAATVAGAAATAGVGAWTAAALHGRSLE